jgi:hypothetical protein
MKVLIVGKKNMGRVKKANYKIGFLGRPAAAVAAAAEAAAR